MARIEDLTIIINEGGGAASVQVHYMIRPSQMDVWTQQQYRETIELIGVDAIPGEDGGNERIPGIRKLLGPFIASSTDPFGRNQEILLASSALDEDPDLVVRLADEIAARVTLTPFPVGPTSLDSPFVRRGVPVDPGLILTPA
jgi:hypothetical protein